MNRPNFQEKTEVKVITHDFNDYACIDSVKHNVDMYGCRGVVVAIRGLDKNLNELSKPYFPGNYPDIWHVDVSIKSPTDGCEYVTTFDDWPKQLEPVQKKFIDIDYIREEDIVIGKKENGTDAIRPKNISSFVPGDIISISTKIDGANASIAWDETTQKLEIFSRTNLLDSPGALRGFYDYIKLNVEPKTDWSQWSDYVFFGEWCVGHSIKTYNKDWFNKWRVYDIWSKKHNCYIVQTVVKNICKELGLEYIEELYHGPFISWEHCRSFLNKSTAYGPEQEGIVIKNQSRLGDLENKDPVYLKIVNDKFKESMHSKKEKKPIDPEVEAARKKAIELAASVVTNARVKKILLKLVDEGKLPSELKPKDMNLVMKLLPKLVFEDVCKEEKEVVALLGEYAGKYVSAETAKKAREIVVGG